jgi:hypothetical protein
VWVLVTAGALAGDAAIGAVAVAARDRAVLAGERKAGAGVIEAANLTAAAGRAPARGGVARAALERGHGIAVGIGGGRPRRRYGGRGARAARGAWWILRPGDRGGHERQRQGEEQRQRSPGHRAGSR